MAKSVMVAGGFDPLHIGHLRHIQKAKELGDYLIVVVNSDEAMINKKGYCFMPQADRLEIIQSIKWVDLAIPAMDTDSTVTKTLKHYRPDIFAKGGDRTPDNMPQSEVDICNELGIEIRYGVGELLRSSSMLVMG